MLNRLYQWIIRRTVGRPVTEILRESHRTEPLVWFLVILIAGVVMGRTERPATIARIVAALIIGAALGHLFW